METSLQKPKLRNSLIELYRFIFALWVMYYHGYFFLPKHQLFRGGYLGVDFFFILTGLFLFNSITRSAERGYGKGLLELSWRKLKPLGVTLIISLVFAQIYFWIYIRYGWSDPFGFMWYIKWLVIIPAIYYTLYYFIKSKKYFLITVAIISVISYLLLHTIGNGWGALRGLSGIGIGILISQIPKIDFKKINL